MNKHPELTLLSWDYWPDYSHQQPLTIHRHIARLQRIEPRLDVESFLVSASVYSSTIEGNPVDLNQYHQLGEMGLKKTRSVQEIDDLIEAYHYASRSDLTEERLLIAHQYLTKTLLGSNRHYRGAYRNQPVAIQELNTGKVIYRGAPVSLVQSEMSKLFVDMERLIQQDLTPAEVFYWAAQIHLRLAGIHPFADGNGRIARLVEKWFISQSLGRVAWYIPSERNYQKRIQSYYKRINLGLTYQQLNYDRCVSFLLMLPWSLRTKN